jgi:hypothetical protein
MTLAYIVGEISSYEPILFNRSAAEYGLIVIATAALILLFFTLIRRKRGTEVSVLIHHNKQKEMLHSRPTNWEKGKKRIEKLLYEMTDHLPLGEFINTRSSHTNNNKRDYHDIPVFGRTNKMLRERNSKINTPKDSATPLDVKELMAVSTLAKRLRARTHHSIRI